MGSALSKTRNDKVVVDYFVLQKVKSRNDGNIEDFTHPLNPPPQGMGKAWQKTKTSNDKAKCK